MVPATRIRPAAATRPARLRQPVYDKLRFGPQQTPQAYDQNGQPFYFPDLEGAACKSKATMFGVIGIFILGFIFGALAILNAGRAEAHGVPATFGKSPAGSSPCCLSYGHCSLLSWSSLLLPLAPQLRTLEYQALTKQPPHLLCVLGRGGAALCQGNRLRVIPRSSQPGPHQEFALAAGLYGCGGSGLNPLRERLDLRRVALHDVAKSIVDQFKRFAL